MILRHHSSTLGMKLLFLSVVLCAFISNAQASYGDRLPAFTGCLDVCKRENCVKGGPSIPLLHRLLLWDCPSECDHACQTIVTEQRIAEGEPIVQFHGKWPFHRVFGIQEPASVIFSLFNLLAHYNGLNRVLAGVPDTYPLKKYYRYLAYIGIVSWSFSIIFHIRDFAATEQLDYFAAGANVLYGMYYSTVRIFRLDKGGSRTGSMLRIWTTLCITLYILHVTYLKLYDWNYSYNMAANVVAGFVQNALWSWFSFKKYKKSGRTWDAYPGLVVAWVIGAMSLELFDFPPVMGVLDAHSLWHLGTVGPTVLFYSFLIKDAQEETALERLKE